MGSYDRQRSYGGRYVDRSHECVTNDSLTTIDSGGGYGGGGGGYGGSYGGGGGYGGSGSKLIVNLGYVLGGVLICLLGYENGSLGQNLQNVKWDLEKLPVFEKDFYMVKFDGV